MFLERRGVIATPASQLQVHGDFSQKNLCPQGFPLVASAQSGFSD
ncbi:MAG: hypothetical protein H6Q48_1474 [Deltaproteobacteria bacterium]|jgi:hypothetical protein|nr:hypothetical protein [Deltaproteobacteria bacterium]